MPDDIDLLDSELLEERIGVVCQGLEGELIVARLARLAEPDLVRPSPMPARG
jgi:hypothetical protein